MRPMKTIRGKTMTERSMDEHLVCGACGCDTDCCAFCDGEDCTNAICYGCVIIEVGQEIDHPHAHGG